MPINPLRVMTNFDVPVYPAPMVRPDPSTWSNLASIGDAIGQYREQAALGELMRNSVNDKGELDLQKAATNIALSGRNPTPYLNALVQRQTLSRQEAAQKALEEHYKSEAERALAPTYQVEEGSMLRPRGYWTFPKKKGEQPFFTPASSAPGPTSAAPETEQTAFLQTPIPPPNPNVPGGNIPLQPTSPGNPLGPRPIGPGFPPGRIGEPNPEEAPPYRVAGPMMPPPAPPTIAQPVAEKPAEAPPRNEGYLKQFPAPVQRWIKGVAEYERDPASIEDKKDRQDIMDAAAIYRPDYKPSGYQKTEKGPTKEQAESNTFANRMINSEYDIADYTPSTQGKEGYAGKIAGNLPFGQNLMTPEYQLYSRARHDWVMASLRHESGAAINKDEYIKQERIFFPEPGDDPKTIAAKAEARRIETESMKASAGPHFKDVTKPRKVASDEEANAARKDADAFLSKVPADRRAEALKDVYRVLRKKGVPPAMWPQ